MIEHVIFDYYNPPNSEDLTPDDDLHTELQQWERTKHCVEVVAKYYDVSNEVVLTTPIMLDLALELLDEDDDNEGGILEPIMSK